MLWRKKLERSSGAIVQYVACLYENSPRHWHLESLRSLIGRCVDFSIMCGPVLTSKVGMVAVVSGTKAERCRVRELPDCRHPRHPMQHVNRQGR